jgi:hypothetical protein
VRTIPTSRRVKPPTIRMSLRAALAPRGAGTRCQPGGARYEARSQLDRRRRLNHQATRCHHHRASRRRHRPASRSHRRAHPRRQNQHRLPSLGRRPPAPAHPSSWTNPSHRTQGLVMPMDLEARAEMRLTRTPMRRSSRCHRRRSACQTERPARPRTWRSNARPGLPTHGRSSPSQVRRPLSASDHAHAQPTRGRMSATLG